MAELFILDMALMPIAATFLFVFAVVFGLLTSVRDEKLFKNSKVNAAIAAVFAIFAASYEPLVTIMQQLIPLASIVLIVIFLLVFIKKSFGGHKAGGDMLPRVVTLAVLLLLIGVFWQNIERVIPLSIDPTMVLWIIGIMIVVMIFWAVHKHAGTPA